MSQSAQCLTKEKRGKNKDEIPTKTNKFLGNSIIFVKIIACDDVWSLLSFSFGWTDVTRGRVAGRSLTELFAGRQSWIKKTFCNTEHIFKKMVSKNKNEIA